jgi:rRNA-processing protein FCF1
MNLLYCALKDEEFNRLSIYESAKEIWDRLELTYEGTTELKESRISILMDKFEKFKMIKGESIDEMHKRFLEIIHPLKNLGKSFTAMELVKKFMKAVIPPYTSKIDAIEEGRDFERITLDILISKLLKKEMEIRKEGEVQVKGKSIALKATSKCSSNDEDSDEDEMVCSSANSCNILRENKQKVRRRRSTQEEMRSQVRRMCPHVISARNRDTFNPSAH